MALTCTDIGKLVHPYLDGEFSDEDRVALEQHASDCAPCHELVQYEMKFKAAMRAKLALPKAPSALRAKVIGSLDELDQLSAPERRGVRWAWLLPATAMTAAAAAIALFFLVPTGARRVEPVAATQPAAGNPFVAEHLVAPIPVVASDTDELDQVERELSHRVGVRVRAPRFGGLERPAMSAQLFNLRDAPAARFSYVLREETGRRHNLNVTVLDPNRLEVPARNVRRVGSAEVLTGTYREFHWVFYTKDGAGYAFTSATLDEDQLVQLATDELRR